MGGRVGERAGTFYTKSPQVRPAANRISTTIMIAIAWKKIRNCIIRLDFRLDALGWVPFRSASVALRKVTMTRPSATTVAIIAATSTMTRKEYIAPIIAFPAHTATWVVGTTA